MLLRNKNIPRVEVKVFLLTLGVLVFLFPFFGAGAQNLVEREVMVLAINDVYRVEGIEGGQRGGLSLVRTLRRQLEMHNPNLLLLHAGDFLFPSLLSQQTNGKHMVEMMNALDGASGVFDPRMFVVFGNHEFEQSHRKDAALLQERIDQSEFHWLGTNIRFSVEEGKSSVVSANVIQSKIITIGNVRVGLFGLTTDLKPAETIGYVDEFLDPIHVAKEQSNSLREQGAEVVIALTHLSLGTDREILERLGERGPDLIIGGHEHQRNHVEINGRWILKADADAWTATVVRIQMNGKNPFVSFGYHFLDRQYLNPDPQMDRKVQQVLKEHEEWFCSHKGQEAWCLQEPVAKTAVSLLGDELEIRRYETNLGNWVADQMRRVVPDADIAFINAGSLRVNQTIPAGPITRQQFEELFRYDSELVQAELTKEQLAEILERATEDWVGQGHWLQISGFAFKHEPRNPDGSRVEDIRLIKNGALIDLPNRSLKVVTNKFLIEGGDGYQMMKNLKWVSVAGSLKKHLQSTLATHSEAIEPRLDGRICNLAELHKRPCIFRISRTP